MKLIGVEEHWCPRELFEKEGTPGYESMISVKNLFSAEQYEMACRSVSDITAGRIHMMDTVGLSRQVLSICNVNMELLQDESALYYSRLSNDILADSLKNNPDRLSGFAALPTDVPKEAAKELERCMSKIGFVGAVINGHIKGHYLDEPKFEPLLEAAEQLNAPLYIHPALPPQQIIDTYYHMDDRYAQKVLASGGWGWHIETGVHVLRLIASGTFDRHPNLKIIVGHLGEGLPFFMERLYNAEGGKLKKPYPEYLKDNVRYSISGFHDPDLLDFVIKKVGGDNIMFSTDFPFNPPAEEVEFLKNAAIDEKTREKIAYKNAERLLNLRPLSDIDV